MQVAARLCYVYLALAVTSCKRTRFVTRLVLQDTTQIIKLLHAYTALMIATLALVMDSASHVLQPTLDNSTHSHRDASQSKAT